MPAAGYPVEWIEVEGLRGKGLRTLAARAVPARRARSRRRCRRSGGAGPASCSAAAASPPVRAASPPGSRGAPLVIHEQNAVAGLTNRWLARVATRIAEGFPGQLSGARAARSTSATRCGREIAALPPPRQRFEPRNGPMRLLVVGGSQGAAALNRLRARRRSRCCRRRAVPGCCTRRARADRDATEAAYARAGVQAEVRAFIDDMAAAYA